MHNGEPRPLQIENEEPQLHGIELKGDLVKGKPVSIDCWKVLMTITLHHSYNCMDSHDFMIIAILVDITLGL